MCTARKADVADATSAAYIYVLIHYYYCEQRVWNPSRTSGTASGGSLHRRYYNVSTYTHNGNNII